MAVKNNTDKQVKKRVYSTKIINEIIKDLGRGYDVDYSPFYEQDIELRAPNVVFEMTPDEYAEYEKCLIDAEYFISKYCKFLTDNGRRLVNLYPHQKTIINTVTAQHYDPDLDEFVPDNRNIIIMASRQSAKTTTTAAYMSWYLCFHTDRNIGIMANKEKTAKEIVDKVTQVFRGLPYFLKPGCLSFGKFGFSLDNGCNLISSATTATASIGFSVHVLYLDEFAHIPKNIIDPFWRSVYPTLSSSKVAQCIVTSTPNGMKNKFFELWDKASKKENSFVPIRVDYWQVPGHDEAWAANFKKDLGEEEFAQEFELQFNVSSSILVKASDLSYINRVKKNYRNVLIEGLEKYENLKWVEGFNPNNISDQDYFIFSIDTAEGKEEGEKRKDNDSNVINIFKVIPNSQANIKKIFNKTSSEHSIKDCFRLYQVGIYEDKFKDEEAAAILARTLIFDIFKCGHFKVGSDDTIIDNCRVLIEMNFNGKNFITHFSKSDYYYEDVVIHTYHNTPIPGETPKKKLGYKTTPKNKKYYCDKGTYYIHLKQFIINNEESLNQLSTFGKDKNGNYKGIASHDDIAMTVLNLSRLFDEPSYEEWLNNIYDNINDTNIKYYINVLLEKDAMDNPEMSDEQFNTLYGLNENNFNYYNINNLSYSNLLKRM